MKYSIVMLLLISFFGSVSAAPGGGHHKTAIYDYHDFDNSNIQSKTFSRYHAGMVYDEVWSFDRTSPGEVVRTEIATDSFGAVTRCVVNVFQATPESYNWTQNSRCDGSVIPPVLISTTTYHPSVVLLTDEMTPGVAWGSAGKMQTVSSPDNYYKDKYEIIAIEDVTVPAGTFTGCMKMHKLRDYAGLFTRIEWICPDAGLVKRVHAGNMLMELTDVTYSNSQ